MKTYTCDLCDKNFYSFEGLIEDISNEDHLYHYSDIDVDVGYKVELPKYEDRVKYVCEECAKSMTKKQPVYCSTDLNAYEMVNEGGNYFISDFATVSGTIIDVSNVPLISGVYPFGTTVQDLRDDLTRMLEATRPIADFSSDVFSGDRPLEVNFFDESSNFPSKWYWDFGDGGTSEQQNPYYLFTKAGVYDISLIVRNDDENYVVPNDVYANAESLSMSTTVKYNYIIVNKVLPIADFYADVVVGDRPLTVNLFDASSTDPVERTPDRWEWFVDGDDTPFSTGSNAQYTFTKAGDYTIKLDVYNEDGMSSKTKNKYITVNPVMPKADFTASSYMGVAPLTVSFQDISTGSPNSRIWYLDRNTTSVAENIMHTFKYPGVYNVYLTVSNIDGMDTISKTITVT